MAQGEAPIQWGSQTSVLGTNAVLCVQYAIQVTFKVFLDIITALTVAAPLSPGLSHNGPRTPINPPHMSSHKLRDDVLLDLPVRVLLQVYPQPRLLVLCHRSRCGMRPGRDEDDLELAPVEVVPDHDLVAVPRECLPRLRDEQVLVRLELRGRIPSDNRTKAEGRGKGQKRR